MQRIDGPTRAAALPAPSATGAGGNSPGFFQRGDPLTGTPPTTLDADWANMVQEEIVSVVVAGGLALDKANHGQLLAALNALYVPLTAPPPPPTPEDYVINPDEFSLPLGGGVILKGGSVTGGYSEGVVAHVFPVAFPTQCLMVVPVAINTTGGSTRDLWAQRVAKSATGFSVMLQLGGGGTTNSIDGFDWVAIGN